MRTYRGLRRHFILTAINYYFLLTRAGGKKDLSVAQLADALQVILERRREGLMSETQLLALAERLARDIARTQRRNHRARIAARRRRLRELAALGIDPDQLPLCDEWAL